jgi:hypothetical protein
MIISKKLMVAIVTASLKISQFRPPAHAIHQSMPLEDEPLILPLCDQL